MMRTFAGSSGLSLRFGIVIPQTEANFGAHGSIKFTSGEVYTLSWKDDAGVKHSGEADIPTNFTGYLELVVKADGTVESRNGK